MERWGNSLVQNGREVDISSGMSGKKTKDKKCHETTKLVLIFAGIITCILEGWQAFWIC